MIDSNSHRHGGTRQMIVKDNKGSDALTIPLDLDGYMINFGHRIPTINEIATLVQYWLTQGDSKWNLLSFSDQVVDKFCQQVIDTEFYNSSSTNLPDDSSVEVNQNYTKLSFYEQSDLLVNNLKGNLAHLVFYTGTVQYANMNYSVPTKPFPL
jgi:hypothetical protein